MQLLWPRDQKECLHTMRHGGMWCFIMANAGGASGLYALGQAVSGTEQIETLSGVIRLEAVAIE